MQRLRPVILAVLLATCSFAALPDSAFAQSCTCPGVVGIRAEAAPPPLPDYDQPPIPAPGYMWTPGYWAWNNEDYYWVPGTWVQPPRPGVLWTPGYWGFSNGLYVFNQGYWGPHVGFYGGVAYGFGYGGSGYHGGRWNNGSFFYNRSVNNISNVNITNVYNEKVVINNTIINHVSFNGGTGGTAAVPTAEEKIAAGEPHEKPTSLQLQHSRAASMNAGSFVSTNHGKPTVAATARPGVLNGPDAVKAKEPRAPATPVPVEEKIPQGTAAPGKEPQNAPDKTELKPEPQSGAEKPLIEKTPAEKTPEVKEPAEETPGGKIPALKEPGKGGEELKRLPEPAAPKAESRPAMEKAPAEKAPAREEPARGEGKQKCGHPDEPACH